MISIDETYIHSLCQILMPATLDTLYMVLWSSVFSVILGLICGIVLYITSEDNVLPCGWLNTILGTIVNIGRSIPFVIIIIAVFPLSKFIVGSSIGRTAAIVPLTIAATPFVARMVESSFRDLNKGVIEAAIGAGASVPQIIFMVLLPETISGVITGITITIINLIAYSAMAGTIGGGGLGDVAIRYGYQRFRTDILIVTIVILIVMVTIIQATGNYFARALDKR